MSYLICNELLHNTITCGLIPYVSHINTISPPKLSLNYQNQTRTFQRRHDKEDGATRGYHPRRGGRYNSEEDRSPSPESPGPRVLSKAIWRARFRVRFRQPTNIVKYSGETNPNVWLADYRLACQLGSANDDLLIIRNLPLFLTDSMRAWLEHLPPQRIHDWADLVRVFMGNF
jgi:hypothetical protein